jgi:5-hydroxyisourate hydrolase-like protein (transthyretin family)
LPARAHADYSVAQCVPPAVPYTDAGKVASGAYSIWGTNECGSGHFYGLRLDTNYDGAGTGWTANGAELAWRFTAPSGTKFAAANATVHYGNDSGFAAASFSNGTPAFQVFASCGTPTSCWTTASTNGGTVFEVRLQCFKSPNCHSDWAYAWTSGFSASLHDGSAPAISAEGPLLSGDVIHGVQSVHAISVDSGGGARALRIYVNGIYSRGVDFCPPSSNGTYVALKPCPAAVDRDLNIDTQKDPGWTNGPNDLVICAEDVAGNISTPCVRRTVEVDNSCPGSGGVAAADLEAGADVGGHLLTRAAVTSKVQPVIRGAVQDGAGNPVAGATVCVYETIDLPDASRNLVSTVTTQGNGRFVTRLDPGPSRRLDLSYRYNNKVLGDRVQLQSKVVPLLEIPRKNLQNGDAAVFRGSVPGPNADERVVALQARVGRKWRTFKQVRTDSDGRFRGKYRFTQTRGRVRYVFRALVKRQNGYPYEPGASHKRKLIVRG